MVVLPSRTVLRLATERWRLPIANRRLIPDGLDLRRKHTGAGRNAGGVVIGTAAALRPEKNIRRLLRAFALLRDASLRAALGQPNRAIAEAMHDEEAMFQAHAWLIAAMARG